MMAKRTISAGELCAVQGIFLGLKRIAFRFCEETLFSRSMVTMVSMLLALAGFAFYWKAKNTELELLPERFGSRYIAATVAAALFLAITLYGLLLGGIRLRTGNSYLGILAHVVLNVFGWAEAAR